MSNASSEPAARSLKFGSTWRIILNVLVIFISSQLIAAFIVEAGLALTHTPRQSFDSSAIVQFFYVLLAEGVAAGAVFLILRLRKLPLGAIGLGRKPRLKDIIYAASGFLAFYVLLVAISLVVSLLYPDINKGSQDIGFNHLNTALDSAIAFLALVLLPPLGEETLVRGYLYSGLRQRFRFVPAMLLTSVFFGAAHLQTGMGPGLLWAAGLNTFVLSLVLVYLREKTSALYAGILVHALNNAIAFGFHFHALMF
jgi:membrane protease YdiL (CAAX protease family)